MVAATREKGQKHEPLTACEQETIINFNKGDQMASIFTYEITWQKHLEKKLGLKPVLDNGFGGREYLVDKSRIFPPKAKRQYTQEQQHKMAKRLAKARRKQEMPLSVAKS